MTKKQKIDILDFMFNSHVVKKELTSDNGYKIILIFDVIYDVPLYRVERPDGEAKGFESLNDAILYYNEL